MVGGKFQFKYCFFGSISDTSSLAWYHIRFTPTQHDTYHLSVIKILSKKKHWNSLYQTNKKHFPEKETLYRQPTKINIVRFSTCIYPSMRADWMKKRMPFFSSVKYNSSSLLCSIHFSFLNSKRYSSDSERPHIHLHWK